MMTLFFVQAAKEKPKDIIRENVILFPAQDALEAVQDAADVNNKVGG